MVRSGWSTPPQHGENRYNPALVGEWNVTGEDLRADNSIQLFIEARHELYAHLPRQNAKCIHIAGLRGPRVGPTEVLRIS